MGLTLALQLSHVHRDSDWFQWAEEEDAELRAADGKAGGRAPGTFHRLQISSNYDENLEQLQFPIKY